MMPGILIVEDDGLTRTLLSGFLSDQGFDVFEADTVATLNSLLECQTVDIALLDIQLPDGNGVEAFLKAPQSRNTLIICMTSNETQARAWTRSESRIRDYIIKPVDEEELLTLIRRLLKEDSSPQRIFLDSREMTPFNPQLKQIVGHAGATDLTGAETILLTRLCLNPGKPVSRNELSIEVLGRNHTPEDRSIDVLVGRIRQKLKQVDCQSQIVAVRTKGYRLDIL